VKATAGFREASLPSSSVYRSQLGRVLLHTTVDGTAHGFAVLYRYAAGWNPGGGECHGAQVPNMGPTTCRYRALAHEADVGYLHGGAHTLPLAKFTGARL
jgi:hypothetical protein